MDCLFYFLEKHNKLNARKLLLVILAHSISTTHFKPFI